ncbi:MAG: VCBS domain-containing protein, partial [Alphaproteobacteria bacterium]|nr:VCBS domain-containing protein [Alphaproteobacteria bacterium]
MEQTAYAGEAFNFILPALEGGGTYSLTSILDSTGSPVSWLRFAAGTRTLSGTPSAADEDKTVIVTLSGGGQTHTYTISIDPARSAPVFSDFTVDLPENTFRISLVNDLATHVSDEDDSETFTFAFADSVPQAIRDLFLISNDGGLRYIGSAQNYDTATIRSWTFDIVVTDSTGLEDTATVTVRLVNNEVPIIDKHVLEHQGTAIVLTATHLSTTDEDDGAATLTYQILNFASSNGGIFQILGDHDNDPDTADTFADLGFIARFTQADIDAGLVRYVPTSATSIQSVRIAFSVTDGTDTAAGTLTIIVTGQTGISTHLIRDTATNDNFDDIWGQFTVPQGTFTVQLNGANSFNTGKRETNPQGTEIQFTKTANGDYGKLFYNQDGAYWYRINDTKDAAINALSAGQRVVDVIEIKDSSGDIIETIIIDIRGANDRPVLPTSSGANTGPSRSISGPTYTDTAAADDFTDDAPPDETGNFGATDPDEGATLTYVVAQGQTAAREDASESGFTHSVQGTYGKLYYNSGTGGYRYVPDNDKMNALGAGSHTDVFEVTANDGIDTSTQHTFTVTINGADDNIVFSGHDSLTIAENERSATIGTVTARDPENVVTISSYALSGEPAGFAIDANGQITYAGTELDHETTPTITV